MPPRPPTSTALLALKAKALKALATSLGVNCSGAKPLLTSEILKAVHSRSASGKKVPTRILSIDMGIRNLALCVLEAPPPSSPNPTIQKSKEGKERKNLAGETVHVRTRVLAWERISIAPRPPQEPAPDSGPEPARGIGPGIQPESRPEQDQGLPTPTTTNTTNPVPEPEQSPPSPTPAQQEKKRKKKKKSKESFAPSLYSIHANQLSRSLLSRFSPIDVILIEQQRHRSMGGSAVQEWTVRVNMFEAMLHAVFRCLFEEGVWKGDVESVSPQRVAGFWIDRGAAAAVAAEKAAATKRKNPRKKVIEPVGGPEDEKANAGGGEHAEEITKPTPPLPRGRKKSTAPKIKKAKTGLVHSWLLNNDVISLEDPSAGETAEAFIASRKKSGRRKITTTVPTTEGKLDDLADCLLQGIAWIRWEENKRLLGEGKLVDLEEPSVVVGPVG